MFVSFWTVGMFSPPGSSTTIKLHHDAPPVSCQRCASVSTEQMALLHFQIAPRIDYCINTAIWLERVALPAACSFSSGGNAMDFPRRQTQSTPHLFPLADTRRVHLMTIVSSSSLLRLSTVFVSPSRRNSQSSSVTC